MIDELYLTITDAEVPTPTASLELIVKLMTSLDIKLWLVETDTKAEIVSIFPVTCSKLDWKVYSKSLSPLDKKYKPPGDALVDSVLTPMLSISVTIPIKSSDLLIT